MVCQALAQAADMRLTGEHWTALQAAIERIAGTAAAARAVRDSDAYQAALDNLLGVEQQVADTIDRFMFPNHVDALGSIIRPFLQLQTNPDLNSIVQSGRPCSSDPIGHTSPSAEFPASPSNSSFDARPVELMEMFPTTAAYVETENPRWGEIHAAAGRLLHDFGIRIETYVDALD